MDTRRTIVLKRIARESMDARRLRAALDPARSAATGKAVLPDRPFTASGKASGKPPSPN